ncbi:hypothetical protein QFC24_000543 [Naganishia onofrii]|uniref:Uncharacterized protein n=1 Tax=Naganishia onofrii TaxID=1851511 RepID=A0ACC2XXK1_9TREE|nr:hypothetical protein QFC24_000543 [Naganishia onofrii]
MTATASRQQQPTRVDLMAYDLYNNGPDQERVPSADDQHVVVDRFADDLPQQLYGEQFLDRLRQRFPVDPDLSVAECADVYMNCVQWIEACMRHWWPDMDRREVVVAQKRQQAEARRR